MANYHFQTLDAKPYGLLQELMQNEPLKQAGFVLCGGGALALHLGHRQSTDMDLFTTRSITPNSMARFMQDAFGPRVEIYNQSDLGIRGFFDGVKFDMIRFPYQMSHPPLVDQSIRFLDLRDAVSMKVHAVANRGLRRDFFDLAEILQKMPLNDVLGRYGHQFQPSDLAFRHTVRSLTFFADAEADSMKIDVKNGRTWEQVRKIVQLGVAKPALIPVLKPPKLVKATNPYQKETGAMLRVPSPATSTSERRRETPTLGNSSPTRSVRRGH